MSYIPELLAFDPVPDTVAVACDRINRNFENIALQFTALPSSGGVGSFTFSKSMLTGGTEEALDGVDGSGLQGGETAVCVVGISPAAVYFYVLKADSGATASVPNVIAPATNPGNKRWILTARVPRIWVGTNTPTVNDDRDKGVVNGEAWVYNNAIWFCTDNTSGAAQWQKLVKIGTTSGTACDAQDSRLSDARVPAVHDNTKHSVVYAAQSDLVSHTGASAPHTGHESKTNKGQANGYASLDGNGFVPTSQIPAIAINEAFPVSSEAEMLALNCQRGDFARRADVSQTYILAGDDPSVLADWLPWLAPGGGVQSVDGREGVVSLSDLYAPVDEGVTNGDAHDHNGGDGAQIDHTGLANKGTNTHTQIDTAITNSVNHIAATAPHSGHATLSGGKVVQDPQSATATPTANKIPIADGSGKLDGWITATPDADASTKGKVQLANHLGGTASLPTVVGVKESGGQSLPLGAIGEGQVLKRSGNTLVGETRYYYLPITIDGGGSVITTGSKGFGVIPVTGNIVSWYVASKDASASIVVDLWKVAFASFPPADANSITASAPPTLSSAQTASSSTLTGWTIAVTAGDWIMANVDSCSVATNVVIVLKIQL